jgi:hypothetical protein
MLHFLLVPYDRFVNSFEALGAPMHKAFHVSPPRREQTECCTPFQAAKQAGVNAAAVTRLNAAISEIVELPPCMGASQPCAPIGALSMAKRVN